mmetsp:Transcript_32347/g.77313  ORF Transcript_32347/g.77313 Transcript_32347/m.77313 type:complete len:614 (+) Transcript_32347:232-2073(+)
MRELILSTVALVVLAAESPHIPQYEKQSVAADTAVLGHSDIISATGTLRTHTHDTKTTTLRRLLNSTITTSPVESRPAEMADAPDAKTTKRRVLNGAVIFPAEVGGEGADSQPSMDIHSPSDHDRLIPLQANDYIGLTLAMIGLILAAGGGIGGGGILVPIYILILNFLPKHAIPLSNVTVFGGSIANTLLNWRKRHPVADRPLIDWDLIVVMEPPTLLGALIGANLNKLLPETAIAILLVVLLVYTSFNTLKKAHSMYQKETSEIKHRNINHRSVEPTAGLFKTESENGLEEYFLLNDHLRDGRDSDSDTSDTGNIGLSLNEIRYPGDVERDGDLRNVRLDEQSDEGVDEASQGSSTVESYTEFGHTLELQNILDEEKRPKKKNIALIATLFMVVLTINILKGGGAFESPLGIECGSASFWVAQILLLIWICVVSWIGRKMLLKSTAKKTDAGFAYLDEDIRWNGKKTIIYPMISTLAGVAAGLFGIGGGIIKGPLMIALGVHPAVASATSACMILFTSFTATTTFSVYGLMVRDYAIACSILGFVSTLVGQKVMNSILRKTNRSSYIAYSIGFVVLLSAILMALQSVLHLLSAEGGMSQFGGICDSHLTPH